MRVFCSITLTELDCGETSHQNKINQLLSTFTNLSTEDLINNKYLEKIVIELHVTEHIASSVCFKLDPNWLLGQSLLGEVEAQALIWVVGLSQRDHVLDAEEQSNHRDKGGGGGGGVMVWRQYRGCPL